MIRARRLRVDDASASKMRSEPGRVVDAGHDRPAAGLFHSGRDRLVVGRDHNRAELAASARRITCTIIGNPAMSASGFPGKRVEAMRAGIRIRTSSAMAIFVL